MRTSFSTNSKGKEFFNFHIAYGDTTSKNIVKNFMEQRSWDQTEKVWKAPVTKHNEHVYLKYFLDKNPFSRMMDELFSPERIDSKEFRGKSVHRLKGYNTLHLFEHQIEAVELAVTRRRAIFAMEMRVGKTRSGFESARVFLTQNPHLPRKLWWIANKSAIMGLKKAFSEQYESKLVLETGEHVDCYFFTYEDWAKVMKAPNLQDNLPPIIIYDEVHKLKSTTSNRGKLARETYGLLENLYEDDFMLIGMTGTPAPKDPTDWFNIIEVVQPGWIPYGHINVLKEAIADIVYLDLGSNTYVNNKYGGMGNVIPQVKQFREDDVKEFIRDYIAPVAYRKTFKEVFDMPPRKDIYHRLRVAPQTKKAMRFLKDTTDTVIQLINKTQQISDGFLYVDEYNEDTGKKDRSTNYLPCPKTDKLREMLNEYEHDRLAVLGGFKATIDHIVEVCHEEGWEVVRADGRGWFYMPINGMKIKDQRIIDRLLAEFDNSTRVNSHKGKLVIVGHPKSVATGLELSACPWMIYYSHTNDGESEMQSIARAYSINMDIDLGLTVHHLVHLAVDQIIIDRLAVKGDLQNMTMREVNIAIEEDAEVEKSS